MSPETAAGRALLVFEDGQGSDFHSGYCDALRGEMCSCELPGSIVAIEREAAAVASSAAVAALLAELRTKVAALPDADLWTEGRTPEDDAECEEYGCEDRTHTVHHRHSYRAAILALFAGRSFSGRRQGDGVRNTWDEEVADHRPSECVECHGTGFYKLPYGCTDDCEDEDNCYCDCHLSADDDKAP